MPEKIGKIPSNLSEEEREHPAVAATKVAADEKDPNPAAINPSTPFKTAAEETTGASRYTAG